jgi:hypothetical protein
MLVLVLMLVLVVGVRVAFGVCVVVEFMSL